MMEMFRKQAERFGTRVITDDATKHRPLREPGGIHTSTSGGTRIRSRGVILAMGAEPKRIGVPGEDELRARVSYCATCDAAFFRGKPSDRGGWWGYRDGRRAFLGAVRGQGDAGPPARGVPRVEDHAPGARRKPKHRVALAGVGEIPRRRGRRAPAGDSLVNAEDGSTKEMPVKGAFIAIGHRPNTRSSARPRGRPRGLHAPEGHHAHLLPGVFAAGDATDHVYRQAVTAAGTGCMAALDAEAYLRNTPMDPEAHWSGQPDKIEAAGRDRRLVAFGPWALRTRKSGRTGQATSAARPSGSSYPRTRPSCRAWWGARGASRSRGRGTRSPTSPAPTG